MVKIRVPFFFLPPSDLADFAALRVVAFSLGMVDDLLFFGGNAEAKERISATVTSVE